MTDDREKVWALEDERMRKLNLSAQQVALQSERMTAIEDERTEHADELRQKEREQAAESAAAVEEEVAVVAGENSHPAPAVVGVSGAPDVKEEPVPMPEEPAVEPNPAPGIEGDEAGKSPEEAVHADATTPPPTDEAGVTPFAKREDLTVETAAELTKSELVDRLDEEGVKAKASLKKDELVTLAAHDFPAMTKSQLRAHLEAQGKIVPASASKKDMVEMAEIGGEKE